MNRILASFAVIALAVSAVEAEVKVDGEIAAGPFKPTEDSLKQYQCPDWFRDAKLGFWAHWGPQAVPRQGIRAIRIFMDANRYRGTRGGLRSTRKASSIGSGL